MKKLISIIALSILTISAAEASTHTTLKGETTLGVSGLRCEVLAGNPELALEDRLNTLLGRSDDFNRLTFFGLPEGSVLLEHKVAFAKGCDLAALDDVNLRSRNGYTFIHGVKTTVHREVTDAAINGFGKCVETVFEDVTFEIAPNIKLVSREGKLRASTRCP